MVAVPPPTAVNVSGSVREGTTATSSNPGVLGVAIELRDTATQAVVGTTTTDALGAYLMNTTPGAYDLCLIVPTGFGLINLQAACQTILWNGNNDVVLSDFTISTLPTITLIGAATIDVNQDATFTDPGATAAKDGTDLTSLIQTTGSVDTAVLGTYTIVYSVTDATTTLSATTSRTVNVVAVPPPQQSQSRVIGSSVMMFTPSLPQAPDVFVPQTPYIPETFAPVVQTPGVVEGETNDLDQGEIGEGVGTSSSSTSPSVGMLAGAVAFVSDIFSMSRVFFIFGLMFILSAGYLAYFLYQKTKTVA